MPCWGQSDAKQMFCGACSASDDQAEISHWHSECCRHLEVLQLSCQPTIHGDKRSILRLASQNVMHCHDTLSLAQTVQWQRDGHSILTLRVWFPAPAPGTCAGGADLWQSSLDAHDRDQSSCERPPCGSTLGQAPIVTCPMLWQVKSLAYEVNMLWSCSLERKTDFDTHTTPCWNFWPIWWGLFWGCFEPSLQLRFPGNKIHSAMRPASFASWEKMTNLHAMLTLLAHEMKIVAWCCCEDRLGVWNPLCSWNSRAKMFIHESITGNDERIRQHTCATFACLTSGLKTCGNLQKEIVFHLFPKH